jgi:quinoprotein glucose dehydrogenase
MHGLKKMIKSLWPVGTAAALLFAAPAWVGAQDAKQPYTTWSTYLGNSDSSHYSALKQINRSNVDKLEVAWSYKTESDRSYEFNPIIVGKTMYVLAKHTSIVALSAATGEELWTYHSQFAPSVEMHRGINFWQSKDGSEQRLLIPFASHLEAIDARTGKLITSFGDHGRVDLREGLGRNPDKILQIQSATPGRVFEDLLILGSATGEEYESPPGDIRLRHVAERRLEIRRRHQLLGRDEPRREPRNRLHTNRGSDL